MGLVYSESPLEGMLSASSWVTRSAARADQTRPLKDAAASAVLSIIMWLSRYAQAAPTRLRFDGERWVLELEEMVRVFGPVYRPVRHRLRGARNIADLLGRKPETQSLGRAAAVLFAAQPEEQGREGELAYESDGGAWQETPAHGEAEVTEAPRRWRTESTLRTPRSLREVHARALLELRDELRGRRRASSTAAAERTRHEPEQEEEAFADQRIKPGVDSEPPPRKRRAPLSLGPLAGAEQDEVAAQGPEVESEKTAGDGVGDRTHDAATPADADAPADTRPEEPGALTMPRTEALRDNLELLLDELELHEVRGDDVTLHGLDFEDAYVGLLVDDDDEVRGAFVADRVAAISLGCGLMGLSAEERSAHLAAEEPDPQILDSTGEVFNTLSGTLNLVSENPNLRVRALAKADLAAEPWMTSARGRLRLELGELGSILILGR